MALDPVTDSSQMEAFSFYVALTRDAPSPAAILPGDEPGLGGNLVYAGELDSTGQALVIAGNVAGCATLAATADLAAQKQAIRDGVVDFLVTSLDEALRILKNEIRRRKTVAVCVGASPDSIEREMQERGVQPDMVFVGLPGEQPRVPKFDAGSHRIKVTDHDAGLALLTWQVAQSPALWMPKLDAVALDRLAPDSWEHRWIRLSPRYLGRSAFARRVLYCDPELAREIIRHIADSVGRGEIGAEVSANLLIGGDSKVVRILPPAIR